MPASRGICEFWRRYLDGIPPYLAQRYWWAYLARPGVWFFDHALIIDAILFGHYAELMQAALTALDPARSTLMIASVYGRLIPELVLKLKQPLVLVDVAPIQLELAARKIARTGKKAYLVRSNAEALGLSTGAFAQALVFFLWHEMP
ncbi:MAG: class I SAM-dependent methyltransferase, partial [Zetaproteobacteria bacterium]